MRLAWCTPMWRESAIAGVSRAVVEEISRHTAIEIVHPPTTDPLSTDVMTHPSLGTDPDADTALLSSFDLVFYCMGDNLRLHRPIYEASRCVPGVVVLHDLVLHHFFADLWLGGGDAPYLAAIEMLYGGAAREIARQQRLSGPGWAWRPAYVEQMPMFELALQGALGVVTHSEFARDQVERSFTGPTLVVPLPYVARGTPYGRAGERRQAGDRLNVLTIGHINPNKRIESVLRALAADRSIAERIRYTVIGPGEEQERERLRSLVAELDLVDTVKLLGRAPDSELRDLLASADICVNLRNPVLEAASASLVEQMWEGKPTVVTDLGCYSEVPDDCVIKTDRDDEVESVRDALRRLVDDSSWRQQVGDRARTYARKRFRSERYAEAILAFIEEVRRVEPYLATADALGTQMHRVGIEVGMPLVDTVAMVTEELFGGALASLTDG